MSQAAAPQEGGAGRESGSNREGEGPGERDGERERQNSETTKTKTMVDWLVPESWGSHRSLRVRQIFHFNLPILSFCPFVGTLGGSSWPLDNEMRKLALPARVRQLTSRQQWRLQLRKRPWVSLCSNPECAQRLLPVQLPCISLQACAICQKLIDGRIESECLFVCGSDAMGMCACQRQPQGKDTPRYSCNFAALLAVWALATHPPYYLYESYTVKLSF